MDDRSGNLFSQFEQHAFENCIPIYLTLELTLRCNLNCVHCYNFDRSQPLSRESIQKELSTDEILEILNQVAALGGVFVAFTGGEALAHPGLDHFVKHARTIGLCPRVKSNATLLSPARAQSLAKAGATDIEISLYGARAETHDSFTSVPGSFEKTIAGTRNAKDAGLHPVLNVLIHRMNYLELEKIFELTQELGAGCAISTELTARYDQTRSSLNYRLGEAELQELYTGPYQDYFRVDRQDSDEMRCGCARNVCGITSQGDVYPCIGAPILAGNLRQQPFETIWRNSLVFQRIRGLSLKDFSSCMACPDRRYCQRSSGTIYANTGNYTGAENWTCKQAAIMREVVTKGG